MKGEYRVVKTAVDNGDDWYYVLHESCQTYPGEPIVEENLDSDTASELAVQLTRMIEVMGS